MAEADSPEAGEEAKGTLEAAQCGLPRSLPGGAGDGQSLVVTLMLASGRTRRCDGCLGGLQAHILSGGRCKLHLVPAGPEAGFALQKLSITDVKQSVH